MSHSFKETFSKSKGRPFLVIETGRYQNPWLSPTDAQFILDNLNALREFVARHPAVVPKLTVMPAPAVPQPVAPVQETRPTPAPRIVVEPPRAEQVSPGKNPSGQTDIMPNVNPKVSELVQRALGKSGGTGTTTQPLSECNDLESLETTGKLISSKIRDGSSVRIRR